MHSDDATLKVAKKICQMASRVIVSFIVCNSMIILESYLIPNNRTTPFYCLVLQVVLTDREGWPLPKVFELVSDSEWTSKASSSVYVFDIFEDAAAAIWDYGAYNPLIMLMLQLYFLRPEGLNRKQHPTPTSSFARSYFKVMLFDNDSDATIINLIINHGMRKRGHEMEFISDHDDYDAVADPMALRYQLKDWLLKA